MKVNELKNFIAIADACGHVPLIRAVHGIGKSESCVQYAQEANLHYEPLILSLMDTGDMLGLPDKIDMGGMAATTWAAPTWYTNIVNAAWPISFGFERLQFTDNDFQVSVIENLSGPTITREELNLQYCKFYKQPTDKLQLLRQDKVIYLDAKRSMLFLDEFNRAPRDILDASLQLILDHRLHSHILPKVRGQETLIVAAINPANGDYGVQEFDPALLDRFVECELEPDFMVWYNHHKKMNGNKIISDFLNDNRTKLHFAPKDGTKGASPRSWSRLGTYMDYLEQSKTQISLDYLKGTIGSALAAQFISFYNNYDKSFSFKQLNALIKKTIKKNPDMEVQELGEIFAQQVQDLDAIKRGEFADTFRETYHTYTNVVDAMPWLVYLHALPLETLGAFLKSTQNDHPEIFSQLVDFDKETTNKALLKKVTSKLRRTEA